MLLAASCVGIKTVPYWAEAWREHDTVKKESHIPSEHSQTACEWSCQRVLGLHRRLTPRVAPEGNSQTWEKEERKGWKRSCSVHIGSVLPDSFWGQTLKIILVNPTSRLEWKFNRIDQHLELKSTQMTTFMPFNSFYKFFQKAHLCPSVRWNSLFLSD